MGLSNLVWLFDSNDLERELEKCASLSCVTDNDDVKRCQMAQQSTVEQPQSIGEITHRFKTHS